MRNLLRLAPCATFLFLGCGSSAPENPTWAGDVAPILAANCVRCHTVPAIGGAPDTFRLDTYENWVADDGRVILGAAAMASFTQPLVQRIQNEDDPMPPRFGLNDRQIETIEGWAGNLVDGLPAAGPPADGNRPPELRYITDELNDDGTLTIFYELRDPDNDVVVGELIAIDEGGTEHVITRELQNGNRRVTWDVAAMQEGEYGLRAELRDPSGPFSVELSPYTVRHGDNNIAPRVRILSPSRDSIVASGSAPAFDIAFEVEDPDSDELRATVVATLGKQRIEIASDEPIDAGRAVIPWPLDPAEVPAGFAWRIEVTVDDGVRARTARSGEFIVSHETTDLTFADVMPILSEHCFCHGGPGVISGLDFGLLQYGGAPEGPQGAFDKRARIFWRAVQQRTMPPVSAQSTMDDDKIARLRSWLMGGAPQ